MTPSYCISFLQGCMNFFNVTNIFPAKMGKFQIQLRFCKFFTDMFKSKPIYFLIVNILNYSILVFLNFNLIIEPPYIQWIYNSMETELTMLYTLLMQCYFSYSLKNEIVKILKNRSLCFLFWNFKYRFWLSFYIFNQCLHPMNAAKSLTSNLCNGPIFIN